MKNIKKFSELKHTTYKSASDKLKEYGLNKRASKLDDYSKDIKKIEDLNNYISYFEKYKEYGTFEIGYTGLYDTGLYEVVPIFSDREYDGDGYDFKIECRICGKGDFYDKINRDGRFNNKGILPLFTFIGDDYGIYDIDFLYNKGWVSTAIIDRKNAIKLKNIAISYFKNEDAEMVDSLKNLPVNEFYFEHKKELKSSTYVSAAEKLLRKHPIRSRKLIDHAEEVESRELREKHKLLYDEYSKYGTFNILRDLYEYTSKSYNKKTIKLNNCAFILDFWVQDNKEYFEEIESTCLKNNCNDSASFSFSVFTIPEDFDDYLTEDGSSDPIDVTFTYDISKNNLRLSGFHLNGFTFSDRKGSGNFLLLLKKIFNKKVEFKSHNGKSLIDKIEYDFLAATGISSEYGLTLDSFIEVLNNTSPNKLYKEV